MKTIEENLILEDEKYQEVTFSCPPKFYENVKFIMSEADKIKDDVEAVSTRIKNEAKNDEGNMSLMIGGRTTP